MYAGNLKPITELKTVGLFTILSTLFECRTVNSLIPNVSQQCSSGDPSSGHMPLKYNYLSRDSKASNGPALQRRWNIEVPHFQVS
jgi:hypothetical protein